MILLNKPGETGAFVFKQKTTGKRGLYIPRFTLSPEGVKRAIRQVSWLVFTAPPCLPGFSKTSGSKEALPLTVAGPRRTHTGFPFQSIDT